MLLKINANLYERNYELKHKKHNWTYTSKIREPPEGWIAFFYGRYNHTNHCELCGIRFSDRHHKKKCVDHDHASGYMRSICCMMCNTSDMRNYDFKRKCVNDELHRYFNLNN